MKYKKQKSGTYICVLTLMEETKLNIQKTVEILTWNNRQL